MNMKMKIHGQLDASFDISAAEQIRITLNTIRTALVCSGTSWGDHFEIVDGVVYDKTFARRGCHGSEVRSATPEDYQIEKITESIYEYYAKKQNNS